ncbi:MAG: methyltransferase domain-containing protein [Phenylobacterium sp.]
MAGRTTRMTRPDPPRHRGLRAPLHAWPAALVGVVAGLVVLVYLPRLRAVSASLLLFAAFHVIGLVVIAGSVLVGWRSRAPGRYRASWINGPLLAAIVLAAAAVALQVSRPGLWPFADGLLAQAVICLVGSSLLRELRTSRAATLPMVDLALSPDATVLDAGCGSGRSTRALARTLPVRVVALDDFGGEEARAAQLRAGLAAEGWGGRVEVKRGPLDRLPFGDATFDAAVSVDVYDHRGATPEAALIELDRVLKPGGRLLLMVRYPGWRSFAVVHLLALALPRPDRWRRAALAAGLNILHDAGAEGRLVMLLGKPTA